MVEALRGRWSSGSCWPPWAWPRAAMSTRRGPGQGRGRSAPPPGGVGRFEESGGTYGYRRFAQVNSGAGPDAGSAVDRAQLMRQEGLAARAPKRRRRYSSYAGEISEAPGTC